MHSEYEPSSGIKDFFRATPNLRSVMFPQFQTAICGNLIHSACNRKIPINLNLLALSHFHPNVNARNLT